MKRISLLFILAFNVSLFAQAATEASEDKISCRVSFDAVKNSGIRDAAASRLYAQTEARIRTLEDIPKEERVEEQFAKELKNCELSVELFKIQLENVASKKNLESINKNHIAVQKELSLVKDSLINLWTKYAHGERSLNAALSDERARLEALHKEKMQALEATQKALAEKDSLLAAQKAEAEKKLEAMRSKTISVYKDARGTILSMSDILFETGKANLKPELKENLAAVGAILQSLLSESDVTIEGHTDNVGSADFNQKLSEQRASAVMQYLIDRGVVATRLTSVGYGLTKPIAPNDTEEGRAKNRRVELVIKDI